ncbi:MAG: carbon monoxide dehydrogenase subunit G [Candidatus Binatia bacterium]
MKVAGTYTIAAPREQVWRFLIDPERLAHCIPGAGKLEKIGENEYAGEINVGLAAVKGLYNGKVKLEDLQPPKHYRIVVDGKGKQGFIKGSGTMDLEEQEGKTLIRYAGDAQIGGPLASVGQRMIDGAAKTMITQFFTAMEAEVTAAPGEVVRQGIFLNLWRYFLKRLRELFGLG